MTDLHTLANAISDSSPNIKAFALAVADKLEPAAPPPPPPPPPTGSGVLFNGLAGSGLVPPWTALQQKEPGRITRLSSGAIQFLCKPGDTGVAGSTTGERAEVYVGSDKLGTEWGREGTDQWTALELYFAPGYPYFTTDIWNACAQWHAAAGGTQPNDLAVFNGGLYCVTNGGPNLTDKPFHNARVASFQSGNAYKFRVHHHWSSGSSGYFAVSVNGGAEVRVNGPNLYASDTGRPYPKLGVYRKGGLTVPSILECRRYAICSSQAAADAVLA